MRIYNITYLYDPVYILMRDDPILRRFYGTFVPHQTGVFSENLSQAHQGLLDLKVYRYYYNLQ